MSASFNIDLLRGYFGGACCPVVKVSGRTFPVEEHFLEDVFELGFKPALGKGQGAHLRTSAPLCVDHSKQRPVARRYHRAVATSTS